MPAWRPFKLLQILKIGRKDLHTMPREPPRDHGAPTTLWQSLQDLRARVRARALARISGPHTQHRVPLPALLGGTQAGEDEALKILLKSLMD